MELNIIILLFLFFLLFQNKGDFCRETWVYINFNQLLQL